MQISTINTEIDTANKETSCLSLSHWFRIQLMPSWLVIDQKVVASFKCCCAVLMWSIEFHHEVIKQSRIKTKSTLPIHITYMTFTKSCLVLLDGNHDYFFLRFIIRIILICILNMHDKDFKNINFALKRTISITLFMQFLSLLKILLYIIS